MQDQKESLQSVKSDTVEWGGIEPVCDFCLKERANHTTVTRIRLCNKCFKEWCEAQEAKAKAIQEEEQRLSSEHSTPFPGIRVTIPSRETARNEAEDKTLSKPVDGDYGNYYIEGLGPEAPTVVGEKGGKQSHSPYAFECIPPLALARMAKVLAEGKQKYGRSNWTKITDHLDHTGKAMAHINAFHSGDCQEGEPAEHLGHALCRLMFALDVIERAKQDEETVYNGKIKMKGWKG